MILQRAIENVIVLDTATPGGRPARREPPPPATKPGEAADFGLGAFAPASRAGHVSDAPQPGRADGGTPILHGLPQCRAESDARTDLFACGLVFTRCTGRKAFDGRAPAPSSGYPTVEPLSFVKFSRPPAELAGLNPPVPARLPQERCRRRGPGAVLQWIQKDSESRSRHRRVSSPGRDRESDGCVRDSCHRDPRGGRLAGVHAVAPAFGPGHTGGSIDDPCCGRRYRRSGGDACPCPFP